MKRLCAIGLMLALGTQSMRAAGPLERSLTREAARLANDPAREPDRSDWRALRALEPHTKLVILANGASVSAAFVSADDTALTVNDGNALRQINVADVEMVARMTRRGSAGEAVAGTVIGLAAAPWLGYLLFGRTSGAFAMAGFLGVTFGVPVAAGYGAWRASSQLAEEVVYRRPPVRP